MTNSDIQKAAARLYFALLERKCLPNQDALVCPYIDSEDVRACVKRLANASGVDILMGQTHIHMLVKPKQSVYATSISELRGKVKTYESKIDLYLLGVVWMVLFAEADTEMSTKIRWENEGITYQQLEVLVSKTLSTWKQKDEETNGAFSTDWALAVNEMYNKWRLLTYNKITNGKLTFPKATKFGVIDTAVRELEKDKMVFVRTFSQTVVVTPTLLFYERLHARFRSYDTRQDRYALLRDMIQEINDSDEVGA